MTMTITILRQLRNENDAIAISKAMQVEFGVVFKATRIHRDWGITMENEQQSFVQEHVAKAFARGYAKGIEAL